MLYELTIIIAEVETEIVYFPNSPLRNCFHMNDYYHFISDTWS